MGAVLDIAIAALLLLGAIFTLLGSLGLIRFSDVLLRLHGPTKAGTLGVGCILVASAIHFSLANGSLSAHELLILLFVFLTAPVSAMLMAKCGLRLERRSPITRVAVGDRRPATSGDPTDRSSAGPAAGD